MTNTRIKLLHFSAGIGCLGSRMTLSAEPTPGVPVADYIKRVSSGYMVKFNGKLVFVPDTSVLAAEVEDMDAKPEPEPVPELPAPMPPPKVVVLSAHERAMQAAIEDRKAAAAERKRIADEIVAKEKR